MAARTKGHATGKRAAKAVKMVEVTIEGTTLHHVPDLLAACMGLVHSNRSGTLKLPGLRATVRSEQG